MKTALIDHLVLSVTDLQRSAAFYRDVLGFDVGQTSPDLGDALYSGSYYFEVGGVVMILVAHADTAKDDRFNEKRVGLDHLSFRAPDAAALQDLAAKLDAAGVTSTGVKKDASSDAQYVVFRDPDGVQLEYWLPG